MLLSMYIVMYLFLGGCTAGLLLIAAMYSVVFYRRRGAAPEEIAAFERFSARCYLVAFILVLASSSCLVFDLGSPRKLLMLFLHPTLTVISFGAYILATTVLVLAFLCFLSYLMPRDTPRVLRLRRIAKILAVFCSIALMSYTGVFLAMVNSVPLWNTPLTVVLFVLSALSAGSAISSLIKAVTLGGGGFAAPDDNSHHVWHAVIIAIEILALAAFAVQALFRTQVAVQRSIQLVLGGPLLGWLVGGVLVLGMLLPLAAEVALARARKGKGVLVSPQARFCVPADVACLLGCFLLRYCLVAAGLH
ncbi:MAG: polysulfide reductase NrfD [Eggerthellaceae bacterium]|nr:polysulfide reductase NrfD [Eggerthellaceae bacterium]